ncbi:hypothetical protein MICRO8M_100020 [Microbacterium sp. 8M]|nr:hypothetical protein MICRO8M_100020 [Microbacterium sp. 8M]
MGVRGRRSLRSRRQRSSHGRIRAGGDVHDHEHDREDRRAQAHPRSCRRADRRPIQPDRHAAFRPRRRVDVHWLGDRDFREHVRGEAGSKLHPRRAVALVDHGVSRPRPAEIHGRRDDLDRGVGRSGGRRGRNHGPVPVRESVGAGDRVAADRGSRDGRGRGVVPFPVRGGVCAGDVAAAPPTPDGPIMRPACMPGGP